MFARVGIETAESPVQFGRDGDLELERLHQLDSTELSRATDSELDRCQPREIFRESSV